jgi:hypothetical protein
MSERDQVVLDWLSSLDFKARRNDLEQRRQVGTCQWISASEQFKHWIDATYSRNHRPVWCQGPPGIRRTVAASAVVEHLRNHPTEGTAFAFIYCTYGERRIQSVADIVGCLLKQLLFQQGIPKEVISIHNECHLQGVQSARPPSLQDLSRLLRVEVQNSVQFLL